MPKSSPPGAPPPPDDPFLNTKKDYEIDNTYNPKYIDESYNPEKKRGTVGLNKDVLKAKKILQSKPR